MLHYINQFDKDIAYYNEDLEAIVIVNGCYNKLGSSPASGKNNNITNKNIVEVMLRLDKFNLDPK